MAITLVLLLTLSNASPAKELLGEETLPGQVAAKKPMAKRNLPPESALPSDSNKVPVSAVKLRSEAELPAALVSQLANPPKIVIGESLLENDEGVPSPSDAQPEVIPEAAPAAPAIGQVPAGLPWLRLNMHGHTGIIRAMSFSRDGTRLCSAGEDKALEVWNRVDSGKDKLRWMHERTIRWQVQRGPLGRIHALAAGSDVMALAGYGAMGGLGEILLVDPVTGELRRTLIDKNKGHKQPVVAMSFASGGSLLASQDISGRALLWVKDLETGLWSPRELSANDRDRYGEQTAKLIAPPKRRAPITFAGNRYVVLPVCDKVLQDKKYPEGVAAWHLERIDVQSLARKPLNAVHIGMVTSLAASLDGKKMASADSTGNLFFWNMDTETRVNQAQNVAMHSLSFSENGQMLAAGSSTSSKRNGNSAVQLWDLRNLAQPRINAEIPTTRNVYAVSLSPDAKSVAYAQNAAITIQAVPSIKTSGERLLARARPVLRVAFAGQEPIYRIAFGTRVLANGTVAWERSFDLGSVRLEAAPQLREADWLSPDSARGSWSVRTLRTAAGESYWLFNGEQQVAQLPLRPELHGAPTATCWIPDRQGKPYAVAVGTLQQNNIYVFRLAGGGEAKVVRQFRGHEGAVRSLGMSLDRRYLVSGSDDATIRIWNLNGFDSDTQLINRWGAEFEVKNGVLVVTSIREDGPLYFRGVRAEDVIHSIQWPDAGQVRSTNQANEILGVLSQASHSLQVVFNYRRGDVEQPRFQMLPAWQQLVSAFVAENREWAFWTPAGYYDASFDGHKLFGWQVNRGVDLLPEFFLAAQFQQNLERPLVMAKLLREGSLEGAFRAAQQPAPSDAQNAVLDQYRLKPRIQIIAPRADELISTAQTKIEAVITVRDGLQLTPPKTFANGVIATERRLVRQCTIPGGRELYFEWNVALPSDPRVVIQVVASTDAAAVDTQSVVVRQKHSPKDRRAKLYIVAAGVNEYRDAQIQRLDYAVSNARAMVDLLRGQSQSLYTVETTMLLNDHATRSLWTLITSDAAARLQQEAQPDDLLVFFLSGHGVRDEETQKYYFVAADARFDDVKAGRFSGCLAFDDFAAFANVPCRKLVVLDTCHSGAIQQPLRQQDLKAALRALQTDVVFTMTASEGSQEASEQKGKQLGRFTARLLEALSGAADQSVQGGDEDGVVTLTEAFRFVSSAVPADSARDEQVQHPTAGPSDLLDYAVLPLTSK